jgi:hypothetical protein
MTDSRLVNTLLKAIRDYEGETEQQLVEANARIRVLEEQVRTLQQEQERTPTLIEEVTDEILQRRLASLQNSPLDTIIREAGVVLEDRLRQVAGQAGVGQHGTGLVEIALRPGRGVLQFSQHPAEQEGVFMLYRGAMQFIRNPPMHNLIEYQSSTAQILLKMIDMLLRLLAEKQVQSENETNIVDIRRMLRRIPIPNGQRELYSLLYQAGNAGLTNTELSTKMNRSYLQLAGVLGALGNRINGTEGLQNKGGILVILDITQLDNGEWRYKMKPVLCKALEVEHVI